MPPHLLNPKVGQAHPTTSLTLPPLHTTFLHHKKGLGRRGAIGEEWHQHKHVILPTHQLPRHAPGCGHKGINQHVLENATRMSITHCLRENVRYVAGAVGRRGYGRK